MKDKSTIIPFSGFSPRSLRFLEEVRERNSKKWFDGHREEYEKLLLTPLRSLVCELSGTILSIDREIDTSPSLNRTISKIYRDTRFSKDKSLFRNEAWISFKRKRQEKITIPEFYFYMTLDSYEFGMGYYAANKRAMDLFRGAITNNAASFRRAISFENTGKNKIEKYEDRYKRTVDNEGPKDLQDWFQLKSFCFRKKRNIDKRLFSSALAKEIAETFSVLSPLYKFIINSTKDG
jgi:uncharacterized protein (TIGR02453 family)